MNSLVLITVVAITLAIYFMPWLIAKGRNHRHSLAIFWAILFFGWTGIFWLLIFIWALMDQKKAQ